MKHRVRWAFALALLPVAACSSNPTIAVTSPPPMALAAADMVFVNAAAASDAAEIGAGQLAASKARNVRVKKFASAMVSAHTDTTQKLTTIAQSKGVTPDATEPQMVMDMMGKLQADKPALFDRDYLNGQVLSHRAAEKTFQDEIANGQDADLKAYAQATLPIIQSHLKMARSLGGR